MVCDPPRLIHDSRVYPNLCHMSHKKILKNKMKTHVMNNPSSTTCFPRLAAELHSACETGTVALRIPIPSPMMVRPTINCAGPKEEHKTSPISVKVAPRKMFLRPPRIFPIYMQARAPVRAPRTKVATTTPWIVALWLFTSPFVLVVSISGNVLVQSGSFQNIRPRSREKRVHESQLTDKSPPTPAWL